MSINGIGSVYADLGIVPGTGRAPGNDEAKAGRIQRPDQHAQAAPAPQRASEAVPAEAPAGTDPQLWQVLSPEERAFFARARALGPLTYAPGSPTDRQAAAPVRGGRVDLKV